MVSGSKNNAVDWFGNLQSLIRIESRIVTEYSDLQGRAAVAN
jgi:hypothetical protein